MNSIKSQMYDVARFSYVAARKLSYASSSSKNLFLKTLARLLAENQAEVMEANALDVNKAKAKGMDAARLDRLTLNPKIFQEMRNGCLEIAAMPDPVGVTESQCQRPNGLLVGKMRIPLGVIAMIYEARPNVTIDAAILCIKSGNAVILRGGSEARESNIALTKLMRKALFEADLPENAAQLVVEGGHESVLELCKLEEFIDVVIPRGGENLIKAVCEAARMPVLKHYKGVCHAFVDNDVNLEEAVKIIENSKTQRVGVCNALECLLVHKDVAVKFLPMLSKCLKKHNVEFRACPESLPLLGDKAIPLTPEDQGYEFHAPILATRIVSNMEEAIDYISEYGSHHTEIICTNNYNHAMRFLREVDASMVAVNASTRFNDGGQLGLGAEIGISTSKLHAYGAMGLKELTTTKFVVLGAGQIRE